MCNKANILVTDGLSGFILNNETYLQRIVAGKSFLCEIWRKMAAKKVKHQ
jgi:hypothetical protein